MIEMGSLKMSCCRYRSNTLSMTTEKAAKPTQPRHMDCVFQWGVRELSQPTTSQTNKDCDSSGGLFFSPEAHSSRLMRRL